MIELFQGYEAAIIGGRMGREHDNAHGQHALRALLRRGGWAHPRRCSHRATRHETVGAEIL